MAYIQVTRSTNGSSVTYWAVESPYGLQPVSELMRYYEQGYREDERIQQLIELGFQPVAFEQLTEEQVTTFSDMVNLYSEGDLYLSPELTAAEELVAFYQAHREFFVHVESLEQRPTRTILQWPDRAELVSQVLRELQTGAKIEGEVTMDPHQAEAQFSFLTDAVSEVVASAELDEDLREAMQKFVAQLVRQVGEALTDDQLVSILATLALDAQAEAQADVPADA